MNSNTVARSHRIDRSLAAIALAAVAANLLFGTWLVVALSVLAVALFGIPHGALDYLICRDVVGRGPSARVIFYAGYVASATAMVALWWIWPRLSLASFLLLSCHHFGESELRHLAAKGTQAAVLFCARGMMVVGVPFFAHPHEAASTLVALGISPPTISGPFASLMIVTLIGFAAGTLWVARKRGQVPDPGHEIVVFAVLVAMLIALPPVVAVALYLSFVHGLAHVLAVGRDGHFRAAQASGVAKVAFTLAALGVIAIAGLLVWLGPQFGRDFVELAPDSASATLSVLVVSVSALTLPHAMTVSLWHRRRRASTREFARSPSGLS
jgi:beta-carotene 15,15'-dioxygenase